MTPCELELHDLVQPELLNEGCWQRWGHIPGHAKEATALRNVGYAGWRPHRARPKEELQSTKNLSHEVSHRMSDVPDRLGVIRSIGLTTIALAGDSTWPNTTVSLIIADTQARFADAAW